MVDYCLVPCEEVANVENFIVRTMSQCEAHLCTSEEGLRVPDHSVLRNPQPLCCGTCRWMTLWLI